MTPEEIKEQVRKEVESLIVGKVSVERTRVQVEMYALQSFANLVGVRVDQVSLINPRWEKDGTVFVWDGFEVSA